MSDLPIIIIGAGLGGLSAAIHLANKGRSVVVLEKNLMTGGKMNEHRHEGFRWDTGPSVITMRHVLDELFRSAGRSLDDYVGLETIEPLTRYHYSDGTVFDATHNLRDMLEQIKRIAPMDVNGYKRFVEYAARLHKITGPVFIYDQPPTAKSLLRVSPLDIFRVDALRTMHQAQREFVSSPHLQQFLGRFATYVGASPYLAPATLNVIAHVELNQGVWYPQGGIYRLARAYTLLAEDLGVEIQTGCRVGAIEVNKNKVTGVRLTDGTRMRAAGVVANLDVRDVYTKLLPQIPTVLHRRAQLLNIEPSCSAFILMVGVRGQNPNLIHHNIFFSSDYHREFDQIFHRSIPPTEPTIYVAITSKSTPEDAPPGYENWFIMVNTPAINEEWSWENSTDIYTGIILNRLADYGYDIRPNIVCCHTLTPVDLEKLTSARGGALYGTSSNNRWAAFRRPTNRSKEIEGLYFAGGTVHPGGGVPMVTLSGKVASQMLINDYP